MVDWCLCKPWAKKMLQKVRSDMFCYFCKDLEYRVIHKHSGLGYEKISGYFRCSFTSWGVPSLTGLSSLHWTFMKCSTKSDLETEDSDPTFIKASRSSWSAFMLSAFRINPLAFKTHCDIKRVLSLTLNMEKTKPGKQRLLKAQGSF